MCTYDLFQKTFNRNSDFRVAFGWVRLKMKTYILAWVSFQHWTHFSKRDDDFWTKSHGPKRDDDEVQLKIFEKKLYTLFYLDLKYKTKTYIQF